MHVSVSIYQEYDELCTIVVMVDQADQCSVPSKVIADGAKLIATVLTYSIHYTTLTRACYRMVKVTTKLVDKTGVPSRASSSEVTLSGFLVFTRYLVWVGVTHWQTGQ